MLAHTCRGCAETYIGPLWFVLVIAVVLVLIVWLINRIPRWLSRRAELQDRNPPPKIVHRRYRFDDQDRIVDVDDP